MLRTRANARIREEDIVWLPWRVGHSRLLRPQWDRLANRITIRRMRDHVPPRWPEALVILRDLHQDPLAPEPRNRLIHRHQRSGRLLGCGRRLVGHRCYSLNTARVIDRSVEDRRGFVNYTWQLRIRHDLTRPRVHSFSPDGGPYGPRTRSPLWTPVHGW